MGYNKKLESANSSWIRPEVIALVKFILGIWVIGYKESLKVRT